MASAVLRQCCQVYIQQWWKIVVLLVSQLTYTDLPYEGSQIVYTSAEVYIMLIYKCHWPSYAKGNL
jgi:hypothetical protein